MKEIRYDIMDGLPEHKAVVREENIRETFEKDDYRVLFRIVIVNALKALGPLMDRTAEKVRYLLDASRCFGSVSFLYVSSAPDRHLTEEKLPHSESNNFAEVIVEFGTEPAAVIYPDTVLRFIVSLWNATINEIKRNITICFPIKISVLMKEGCEEAEFSPDIKPVDMIGYAVSKDLIPISAIDLKEQGAMLLFRTYLKIMGCAVDNLTDVKSALTKASSRSYVSKKLKEKENEEGNGI